MNAKLRVSAWLCAVKKKQLYSTPLATSWPAKTIWACTAKKAEAYTVERFKWILCLFCDEGPRGEWLQVGWPWGYKSAIVGSHFKVADESITPNMQHTSSSKWKTIKKASKDMPVSLKSYQSISKLKGNFCPNSCWFTSLLIIHGLYSVISNLFHLPIIFNS